MLCVLNCDLSVPQNKTLVTVQSKQTSTNSFDRGYYTVPWVRHNLQFNTFTSQVIEKQLGTRSPLGMDTPCQTCKKFNRRATAGLLFTVKSKYEFKTIQYSWYLKHWEPHLSAGLQAVDDCISRWTQLVTSPHDTCVGMGPQRYP